MAKAWQAGGAALALVAVLTGTRIAAADKLADAQTLEQEVENGCLKDLDPAAEVDPGKGTGGLVGAGAVPS